MTDYDGLRALRERIGVDRWTSTVSEKELADIARWALPALLEENERLKQASRTNFDAALSAVAEIARLKAERDAAIGRWSDLRARTQEVWRDRDRQTLDVIHSLDDYVAEKISGERFSELLGVNVAEVMGLTGWIANRKAEIVALKARIAELEGEGK